MSLDKLSIRGYRPFYEEQSLDVNPGTTVLTGANDAGKSAVLDIIRGLSSNIEVTEDDANVDLFYDLTAGLQESHGIRAVATFRGASANHLARQSLGPRSEIDIEYVVMPKLLRVIAIRDENGNRVRITNDSPRLHPRVIDLSNQEVIKTSIPKSDVNRSENKLLELAFGSGFWDKLEPLSRRAQNQQLKIANEKLNSLLASVKPESLRVEFTVDFESREPLVFTVGLQDTFGGIAWPHLRGAGYQKLIRLMFLLLTIDVESGPAILLYDEPENSLHADAQHSFRQVLESFAEHRHIQVIYATHSPAMINPSFPKSVRLLYREKSNDGFATTRINNKPYADGNFQLVRSSLGMSPADSLLYAPITVIVEGATESLTFNRLFKRLIENPVNEIHNQLHRLVGLIHFLGGEGTSFVRWAKMANSQPAVKPVVFVDGDQIKRAKQINDVFPEIPIIHFDETDEIEDIVPREVYFKALHEYAGSNKAECSVALTFDEFTKWEEGQSFQPSELFSNRVGKWYKAVCDYDFEKAEVMEKAIEIADLDELSLSKIDELIEAIKSLADSL